eukprot:scaffold287_cov337-Pavlova_lutheri.AAC.15
MLKTSLDSPGQFNAPSFRSFYGSSSLGSPQASAKFFFKRYPRLVTLMNIWSFKLNAVSQNPYKSAHRSMIRTISSNGTNKLDGHPVACTLPVPNLSWTTFSVRLRMKNVCWTATTAGFQDTAAEHAAPQDTMIPGSAPLLPWPACKHHKRRSMGIRLPNKPSTYCITRNLEAMARSTLFPCMLLYGNDARAHVNGP